MKTTIKVFIICLLILAIANQAWGRGVMYASGAGFFCLTESTLKLVIKLERHNRWRQLESMYTTGRIRTIQQGVKVRVLTYRKGIYRVQFPGSETIWWTTEKSLMHSRDERL